MWNECEQLWASHAAQALDARLTTHVVAPSVNLALETKWWSARSSGINTASILSIFVNVAVYNFIRM